MTLGFDIPDDVSGDTLTCFCLQNGWQAHVVVDGELVENPESKLDFATEYLKSTVKASVNAYKSAQAVAEAAAAAGVQDW